MERKFLLLNRNESELAPYLEGLKELYKRFDESLEYFGDTEEDLYGLITSKEAILLLIDPECEDTVKRVRGFMTLAKAYSKWELTSSFVRPEDRNMGYWGKMMDLMILEAKKRDIEVLWTLPAVGSDFLEEARLRRGFVKLDDDDFMYLKLK